MTAKQVLNRIRDFLAAMYGLQSYDEAQFQREVQAVLQPTEGEGEGTAEHKRMKTHRKDFWRR